jgi:hypothetical protein
MNKMKKSTVLSLITLPLCLATSHGAVLLAGWDGSNPGGAGKTGTTITSSYASTGLGNEGWNVADLSAGKWGTATFTPVADATKHVGLIDGATATITFTITNSGTNDISLDSVHSFNKRDSALSPSGAAISFVSSTDADLTEGAGATLTYGAFGDYAGYDQSISSVFAGTNILSAGETVVIALDFTGDADENSRFRLGNVAFSGTVVPEPSSAALLGLGGLALILRRRK